MAAGSRRHASGRSAASRRPFKFQSGSVLAAGGAESHHGQLPHSYYVYRNQSMGFDYELANSLPTIWGSGAEVVPCGTWRNMLTALHRGRGDFDRRGA